MSNQLNMAEQANILTLFKQGWSKRKIARELRLHRDTVRRCIKQAQLVAQPDVRDCVTLAQPGEVELPTAATGSAVPPGSKQATPTEVATGSVEPPDSKQATPGKVATGSEAPDSPPTSRSKCEPFRQLIETKIVSGLTAQRIFQDLSQEHGFSGAYNAVKRMVRRLTAQPAPPY